MRLFADTSFLVSYYIPDTNSSAAKSLIHASTDPLPFTGLHRLEMRNALELGVFRKFITNNQAAAAWSNIQTDLHAGRLVAQSVNWSPIFRAAFNLAKSHSHVIGCRSLDLLHVSLANSLHASEFLTFDGRQKSVAQYTGLVVRP